MGQRKILRATRLTCTVTEGTGSPSMSWIRACCGQKHNNGTNQQFALAPLWLETCVSSVYRLAVHAGGHGSFHNQVLLRVGFRQNV